MCKRLFSRIHRCRWVPNMKRITFVHALFSLYLLASSSASSQQNARADDALTSRKTNNDDVLFEMMDSCVNSGVDSVSTCLKLKVNHSIPIQVNYIAVVPTPWKWEFRDNDWVELIDILMILGRIYVFVFQGFSKSWFRRGTMSNLPRTYYNFFALRSRLYRKSNRLIDTGAALFRLRRRSYRKSTFIVGQRRWKNRSPGCETIPAIFEKSRISYFFARISLPRRHARIQP